MINAKTTQQFLHLISHHLSSRVECRKIEYVVVITDTGVSMDPYYTCFPDRHTRRPETRRGVVDHVLLLHGIDTGKLVPGTYKYELSVDQKRRRWTRLL